MNPYDLLYDFYSFNKEHAWKPHRDFNYEYAKINDILSWPENFSYVRSPEGNLVATSFMNELREKTSKNKIAQKVIYALLFYDWNKGITNKSYSFDFINVYTKLELKLIMLNPDITLLENY